MKAKFPGFKKCMQMMRSRDPQTQEDGFHWLEPYASQFVSELVEEFGNEEEFGLRCWFIELISVAKSPDTFHFLAAQLRSDDWRIRKHAIVGLKTLGTKQARTMLWEARSFEMETKEATERFRKQLEAPDSW